MGSMLSELADGVLGVVESVGSSTDTVARYRKCCSMDVNFCEQRGVDALSAGVVDEFVACQQDRARRGDTEMKRQALEKANIAATPDPLPTPLWHGREDIIQRLCGLKN